MVLLLEHGAKRNAKNVQGKTPLDFAQDATVVEALNVRFRNYVCTGRLSAWNLRLFPMSGVVLDFVGARPALCCCFGGWLWQVFLSAVHDPRLPKQLYLWGVPGKMTGVGLVRLHAGLFEKLGGSPVDKRGLQ